MKWQAPGADSGKIYFFAAGNSTNGDDLCFTSGDYVFTTAESTTFGGTVGVGDDTPFLKLGTFASPNPMTSRTDAREPNTRVRSSARKIVVVNGAPPPLPEFPDRDKR